ncbi:undecaprenyldiphospho-muramoylpentapeptide beta-N-acetylglucosaminyltransferase [Paraglaciecola arctica]|uniref:UDP-N-acetylglucosamine--N-acetylmuramyl-(pentapeptide) pyrophosphoryl-undecaprenol N-acetylglucosamine transferase n=1 Tax=Paraglaciecola arctica BSs20135 TaxID=493475 RepID=K6YTF0_9ALTE|nr:undecaprenyldiphospho-muramoylpentapeptide beta-N-acetylglucosaminyltransferase [Paraglaciecola arctica]GAC21432.1 UDP-N-acetylglucosamine--N-acetylmuramyl-(pentapeptide) pyrophosphoryl-undecaprenol N-acetylglucosamine transferase [Paraglaciecola arctica BSs20135]
MTKRLLVMAGGTGGHVFPGLAVASELAAKNWQIHWLGTAGRMEAQIVPQAGYPISFIDVVGVRKNGLGTLLLAPFKVIKAIFQAHKVIQEFKPHVVIGMGGFASGPGGVAAWLNRLPLILHEQNAVPGLTNKLLSYIAKKVLTGFDNTFPEQQLNQNNKYAWVGNPVRREFAELTVKDSVDLPLNLLVIGGSLGAQVLNETVPLAVANIKDVNIRHQTGAGHLTSVQETYSQQSIDLDCYQITEFIDDIPAAYAWADLVICRAGALTVAEVAAAGVAAIFVPLPYAVDDHQTKNAQTLVDVQAAHLLPQSELTAHTLQALLQGYVQSPNTLIDMGKRARTFARLDAAQEVAHCCIELSERAA